MKVFIQKTIAAAIVALPTSAFAFDANAVKSNCEAEWPGDFFMQKGCIDLQRESWDGLPGSVNGIPDNVGTGILERCKAEWPDDFFMQKGCADLQVESWRELNG